MTTTFLSWRVGFLLEVVVIAVVVSGLKHVRDVPYTGPCVVDVLGALVSTVGMGGVVIGILVGQAGGEFVGVLIAVGLVALGSLARWLVRRKREGKPTLLDPDLFKHDLFRLGISLQMLQNNRARRAMIALPIYLQMVLEYNALENGLTLAPLVESKLKGEIWVGGRPFGDGRRARRRGCSARTRSPLGVELEAGSRRVRLVPRRRRRRSRTWASRQTPHWPAPARGAAWCGRCGSGVGSRG